MAGLLLPGLCPLTLRWLPCLSPRSSHTDSEVAWPGPASLSPLSLQVYSLVVILPKTPLKERVSLPCEYLPGQDRAGGSGEPWG